MCLLMSRFAALFPLDVLDETWDFFGSVSKGFLPTLGW